MSGRAGPARARVALLAACAVLFQAVLFGWHHHPVPGSGNGQTIVRSADGVPLSPLAADDDCDICQSLHHHSATQGGTSVLPGPVPLRVASSDLARKYPAGEFALPFQARAPPRA